MNVHETLAGDIKDDRPRALGRLFFDLITGSTDRVDPERIRRVEEVWNDHDWLQVTQDGATGRFSEKSVRFILNSTVGVAIVLHDTVGVTQGSSSPTELILRTTGEGAKLRPAFTIRPIATGQ